MERTVAVINAGVEELSQHIVLVGCADQLINGQTTFFGKVTGQNVAEIASGYAEIYRVAHADATGAQQTGVGPEVVGDLRCQTTPVDGVGTGEGNAVFGQLFGQLGIGKNGLYATLCIVKVALDGQHVDVVTLLGSHLQTLNLAGAAVGIENADLGAGYVGEAFQRGLSGIAGGGHQNGNGLAVSVLFHGAGHQVGQHLQGEVFEGAGGAVIQLQRPHVALDGGQGSDLAGREIAAVSLADGGFQLFCAIIGQESLQYGQSSLPIVQFLHPVDLLLGKLRQFAGEIETAVGCQTVQDCLRSGNACGFVTGAAK